MSLLYLTTLVVLALGVGLVSGYGKTTTKPPPANVGPPDNLKAKQIERMRVIGLSNQQFTTQLYTILAREEGNMFFSPLSIHSILTLASLGAKGKTKSQLKHGLSLPEDPKTKEGYKAVNKAFNNKKGNVTLTVANKIYINKGATINSEFQSSAKAAFQTELEGIDFRSPVNAARTINAWVEQQTNNKIKDIVDPGALGNSAMVLVNAVYFKAGWESVFSPDSLFTKDFKVKDGEAITATMLFSKTEFRYQKRRDLKCQLVELDYVGKELSMVVILPDELYGLAALEEELARVGLESVTDSDKFRLFLTTVILPKFKLVKTTVLNGALQELGMRDMFGGGADFSGMTTGDSRAKISDIAHKAFIEVNEEGTEAAGASFGGEPLSAPPPQEYFVADHPFIYLIQHKKSRNILFIGRFSSPPPQEHDEEHSEER